jgi:hypothetical protein
VAIERRGPDQQRGSRECRTTKGTAYTVRHTPKTIVVAGGDVSQILVNGADVGLTAGAFKLGVGETIAITYNTSAPTTLVLAE